MCLHVFGLSTFTQRENEFELRLSVQAPTSETRRISYQKRIRDTIVLTSLHTFDIFKLIVGYV